MGNERVRLLRWARQFVSKSDGGKVSAWRWNEHTVLRNWGILSVCQVPPVNESSSPSFWRVAPV